MKRQLSACHEEYLLNAPFRISRGVKTAADVVTVRISDGDTTGWGEAVPYPRYGETIENTIEAINSVAPAIEAGAGVAELQELLPAGAARNAIDCALWDLEAKLAGTTVAELAGLAPAAATPTAMTISLDDPIKMAEAAARHAHMPVLKVKVDDSNPETQISAVRANAPGPQLIVDPNESWSIDLLRKIEPLLVNLRVDLLEQPLPAEADGALEDHSPLVPIAADESFHTMKDLAQTARRYQVVNIKLDKSGGLTEALALAKAATAQGLELMLGCMICSSLSIAPILLLAGRASFIDLDGPLWLASDRPGGITGENGVIAPPAPGFWGN